jgi:hypothetical protein
MTRLFAILIALLSFPGFSFAQESHQHAAPEPIVPAREQLGELLLQMNQP